MSKEKNKYSGMTEEQILSKLLEIDGEKPKKTVAIERLGIPVVLRGLSPAEVSRVQEQATRVKNTKTGEKEIVGDEANLGYIVAATVSPNWADKRLLDKFNASTPQELLKRMLLAGEVVQMAAEVLELSGFLTELEEVKN